MRVDNQYANDLLISVRNGQRIKDFMDTVSGVTKYRLDNPSRQGCIRSLFAKELIADQFLLDIDDIISIFWKGVFEHLDRAKLWGEIVEIKVPGMERYDRPTQNNPIHFLRNHGYMAVRNYITSLYRKNLEQWCQSCGRRSAIKNDKTCPDCNSQMSTVYKFLPEEHADIETESHVTRIDNANIQHRINNLLFNFAENVLGEGTRAYQVLKILIDPCESRNMCGVCKLCDADHFDIDTCTNYNANIAKWLGVNKTMIASKVRSIRKRFPEWLVEQQSDEANYILGILPKNILELT